MRLTAFAVVFSAAAIIAGANGPAAQAQTENQEPDKKTVKKIKVERGDTLIKIAKQHKTKYQRIFDANLEIKDPDLIYPGDVLRIPHPDEELKSRPIPIDEAFVRPAVSQAPEGVEPAPRVSSYKPRRVVAFKAPTGNLGVWDRLAGCEAGGNWSINTGNGYYGGLQFTLSSWRAVGGSGYPHQASKSEQIARGQKLQAIQGWGAWPACTAKLGIR